MADPTSIRSLIDASIGNADSYYGLTGIMMLLFLPFLKFPLSSPTSASDISNLYPSLFILLNAGEF